MDYSYSANVTASTTATSVLAIPVAFNDPYVAPATPPKPPAPLEWLDSEIEKTCAVARSA